MAGTHNLTGELILRQVFDPSTGSLLTAPASATAMAIEIDAADGDNILTKPNNTLQSVVDTAVSCVGMKSAQLYIEPGAAATAKIQISPTDSGDVWMDLVGASIANDPTNLVATSLQTICARRIRATAVVGTPVIHLVLQAV